MINFILGVIASVFVFIFGYVAIAVTWTIGVTIKSTFLFVPVALAWNNVMPEMFNVSELTYVNSWLLIFTMGLLLPVSSFSTNKKETSKET